MSAPCSLAICGNGLPEFSFLEQPGTEASARVVPEGPWLHAPLPSLLAAPHLHSPRGWSAPLYLCPGPFTREARTQKGRGVPAGRPRPRPGARRLPVPVSAQEAGPGPVPGGCSLRPPAACALQMP